jgi:hypothetical protein
MVGVAPVICMCLHVLLLLLLLLFLREFVVPAVVCKQMPKDEREKMLKNALDTATTFAAILGSESRDAASANTRADAGATDAYLDEVLHDSSMNAVLQKAAGGTGGR